MMKPRRIGIVAIEGVQLLDVAGPADVFAEANVRAGRTEYEVRVLAVTPGTISDWPVKGLTLPALTVRSAPSMR